MYLFFKVISLFMVIYLFVRDKPNKWSVAVKFVLNRIIVIRVGRARPLWISSVLNRSIPGPKHTTIIQYRNPTRDMLFKFRKKKHIAIFTKPPPFGALPRHKNATRFTPFADESAVSKPYETLRVVSPSEDRLFGGETLRQWRYRLQWRR